MPRLSFLPGRRFQTAAMAMALAGIFFAAAVPLGAAAAGPTAAARTFLGFDTNDYPGEAALPGLRRAFTFAGYWLNAPPGETANSWRGKRAAILGRGFGFLVLFNGRLEKELRASADAAGLGASDAREAAANAKQEGFATGTVIFLDQEEGGRMTAAQLAYILGWVDGVTAEGFRAGIYCSGMPAREGKNVFVVTAQNIRSQAGGRKLLFFVYNDACPPAPGCVAGCKAPAPGGSGVAFAEVWQFAQSPRRREFTRSCRNTYARDGNCYAGGAGAAAVLLDLDSATSADPSDGRR